jgi:hypothetical protein
MSFSLLGLGVVEYMLFWAVAVRLNETGIHTDAGAWYGTAEARATQSSTTRLLKADEDMSVAGDVSVAGVVDPNEFSLNTVVLALVQDPGVQDLI